MRNCRIPDCTNTFHAKNLCFKHYKRLLKYGSPEITKTAETGALLKFIQNLVANPTNHCVIWPFGTSNGYGSANYNGAPLKAHRLALHLMTGVSLSTHLEAAHGPCNNPLCINPHPEHGMRWKTPAGNRKDMIRDGTSTRGEINPGAKLKESDILAIRNDPRPANVVAIDYGVIPKSIRNIRNRVTWGWLD